MNKDDFQWSLGIIVEVL